MSRAFVAAPRAVASSRASASRDAPREMGVVQNARRTVGRATANGLRRRVRRLRLHARDASTTATTYTSGLSELTCCVEAEQFDRAMMEELFDVADAMERVKPGSPESVMLQGYLMSTLFYEPSTRTRLSFEAAMGRLGGGIVSTESAGEYSSAAKGETLEDTMRTVEGYCDLVVLRHFNQGSARRAADAINKPLINAGDGPGQHPTQALLDVYTIRREIGRLDDFKIALVGDLANGRTVRSLATALTQFNNVKFYFVAPEVVKMKDDIKQFLTDKGCEWEEASDLAQVAADVDVLYQTRIQKERFANLDDYAKASGKYIVDKSIMDALPKTSVVMHPLPRVDEITVDCDADPRAGYFRQAQNGLFIRMALLKVLLKV
ncbi:aspartate carbamoyltransferase [Ostreococcus tauri]|uniref:aspartate carbamoyltransferase n=1 Tax=Ostreococcus tauri TaxID=70448 RepID=A0A1Y5IHL4_OSTTA|nr:aspartate carbamoyltransferase [Ostreococcus tauri]